MMRALAVMSAAATLLTGPGSESLPAKSTCALTQPIRAEPLRDPKADPFGTGPWYVNADRSIWAGGDAVRMVAGEKGNKVLWIRPQGTKLVVSGRRLDAEASPPKASMPCCYPTGFQASGLTFSTQGCWEISAKAWTSNLTFVTRVGPDPFAR
jgi:hypothetical protein